MRTEGAQQPRGVTWRRWAAVAAGFAALTAVILVQRGVGGGPVAAPTAAASSSRLATTAAGPSLSSFSVTPPATVVASADRTSGSGETGSTSIPSGPWSTARPAIVTTISPSALPRSAGWEIVGYGPEGSLSIDPATGRVSLVPGPLLSNTAHRETLVSAGSYSLVLVQGSSRVLVPDSGPAQVPSGVLARASWVLPGPNAGSLWTWESGANSEDGDPTLLAVDWHGQPTGVQIVLPSYIDRNTMPISDGAGYALLRGVGGIYDVRPDGLRLITSGIMLAVGATDYLVYECGLQPTCSPVVVDRKTGTRRVLAADRSLTATDPWSIVPGEVSPDGTHATYVEGPTANNTTAPGIPRLHLVDLRSGRDSTLPIDLDRINYKSTITGFSADGDHLVVAAIGGTADLVDTGTESVRPLLGALPAVDVLTTQYEGR